MPKSNNKRKNGKIAVEHFRAPSAPVRVSARAQAHVLSQDLQRLAVGAQQAFNEVNQEIHKLRVFLGAVIDVLDLRQKVENKIKADNLVAQQKVADEAKAAAEKLIEQRVFVPVTEIGEQSIIVGFETDNKTGEIIPPGRLQMQVGGEGGFREDLKVQVLGKGVGFKLVLPDKTLEITEIYNIDNERIAAMQIEENEKVKAAAQAAQKAAEESAKAVFDAAQKAVTDAAQQPAANDNDEQVESNIEDEGAFSPDPSDADAAQ